MKLYNSAPLPFQGQKRRWVSHLRELLPKYADVRHVVDLFGGSGLLSRVAKDALPDAHVVYNDFDGYAERLAAIPMTNCILQQLRTLVESVPRLKRIAGADRQRVETLLSSFDALGGVDWVTLGSNLLFSGRSCLGLSDLRPQTLYNCVVGSDYSADGYLDGLDVVHEDYRELFARYENDDTLFLLDPPYLQTDTRTYSSYWKLSQYLDMLELLSASRFVFFTSSKSTIVELLEWMWSHVNNIPTIHFCDRRSRHTTVNYSASYEDIMLFK